MRKIKFRAFNNYTKTISYHPVACELLTEATPLNMVIDDIQKDKNYSELEQFTGLLDKNGEEIYEGDIIQIITNRSPKNFVVVYTKEIASFMGHHIKKDGGLSKMQEFMHNLFNYEIIGNIHENKDLLKWKQ